MAAALSALVSFVFPPAPGQSEDHPLELKAVPGLTTLLDLALFRSNEGQLTATICSSHALLACWLDTKHQSQLLLQSLVRHDEDSSSSSSNKNLCESFARQCLECSMDAIERLSTDKFSQSANLTDPYESLSSSSGGGHHNTNTNNALNGVGVQGISTGILESKEETCRRAPMQRRKDCWESPRLFCPDHIWADDSYSACQRFIRSLAKHPFVVEEADALSPLSNNTKDDRTGAYSSKQLLSGASDRQASLLIQLIQEDLPMRLYHFRQAMEADAVVTKRLYLVKSEYRAPFRAFLEAHQTLLRAPPMGLVESCLQSKTSSHAKGAPDPGQEFQELLKTPALVELLALERESEQLEQDIGQAIYPFSELARNLDQKKARLKAVSGLIADDQLLDLQDTVRRLKCILCRKGGTGTSTGIRPILLDLQGFPRDDEVTIRRQLSSSSSVSSDDSLLNGRIDDFLWHLECLSALVKKKNAFAAIKPSSNHQQQNQQQPVHDQHVEFNAAIAKGCTEAFDVELLKCQLLDWFAMVERQHVLQTEHGDLPDRIRQAEMAMSISEAPEQSLTMVKERLERMQADRNLRLDVLKELLEDLCLREMNLYVQVTGPDPKQSLVLKKTSAVGFLGIPLQMAGENLPIG